LRYKYGSSTGKSKKTKSEVKVDSKTRHLFLAFVVLILLILTLQSGLSYASSAKYNDQSVVPWKDAGEWIKKNTPEDALLIHWWDYGYHLQTFAERRTIVDGGNAGPPVPGGHPNNRNIDVAKAFTSPEDKFYEYIRPYNPENRPIYVLVSIEEFGKSGAINYHAKDELFITSLTVQRTQDMDKDQKTISEILKRNQINTYYIINYGTHYLVWALIQVDQQGNYHPEWSEKVLAKLLPFNTGYGQGLRHFQLVYQNGYVFVYKYVP
jgi:hydroxylamine oxidation protein HaoB